MAGNTPPGPLGTTTSNTAIDQGTLALTASPAPVTVGVGTAPRSSPAQRPPPTTPIPTSRHSTFVALRARARMP